MQIRAVYPLRRGTSPHVHQSLAGVGSRGMGENTVTFDSDGSMTVLNDAGEMVSYTDAAGNVMTPGSGPSGPFALQSQSQNSPQSNTNWWKDVMQLSTQALTVKQTYDINQINVERVKQGKTPLTPAQMQALAPQLNFGLATQTQKMLLYVALGLGGVWLASSMFKHRR